MTPLTREEIRRACLAVPEWEWCGEEGAYDPASEDHYFRDGMEHLGRDDALALLEATRKPFRIRCAPENRATKYAVSLNRGLWCYGPDLPTAAVRAVNAWAEARERKTP